MKAILVGFDAFDPFFFERLHNQGKTPHLSKYLDNSGYSPFQVSNPPQSEVSWTSIATGLNPGGHGLFDFVHRNLETYHLFVSLLPTKESLLGRIFSPPHKTETIFNAAVKVGYPAVSLWWPATFPAQLGSPVQTIPGLGTPDIFGQLGVGISYSVEPLYDKTNLKTRTDRLEPQGRNVYKACLAGPVKQNGTKISRATQSFQIDILQKDLARLSIGKQVIDLEVGIWSPVIEINFELGPLVSIKSLTRVIITQLQPNPALYFLPLQIHPLGSPWPYGTPQKMLRRIWKTQGPFLTSGWPQDTTALEEGFINEDQFLSLCSQIFTQRVRIFMTFLDSYHEGVLAGVFDSLDRVQHMFWKNRPEVIETWYLKLDDLAGKITAHIDNKIGRDKINLLFLSDHGFQNYDYKIHVNRWLINQGYLKLTSDSHSQDLSVVDWKTTQAYAIGLNSLYLNLNGREKLGSVTRDQKEVTLETIRKELLDWSGPDGKPVFQRIQTNTEAFYGPLAVIGPDLVLGFNPGYRASSETGLGGWGKQTIEKNAARWNGDHCFDSNEVPGVLFHNRGLGNFQNPSYSDIPAMTIEKNLGSPQSADPVISDEDQEILNERLKGLGYL